MNCGECPFEGKVRLFFQKKKSVPSKPKKKEGLVRRGAVLNNKIATMRGITEKNLRTFSNSAKTTSKEDGYAFTNGRKKNS